MTGFLEWYLFSEAVKGTPYAPYLTIEELSDLQCDENSLSLENGTKVEYFFYFFPNAKQDKLVLFLPGVGPGHKAYLREIYEIAKRGYRVLTLDYAGCGKSEGEHYEYLLAPTRDTIALLDHLNLKEEITLVGHSLGGFTTLNVLSLTKIKKAVALSPFLSTRWWASKFRNADELNAYEKERAGEFYEIDVPSFLENTDKSILFIHSRDDRIVPYSESTALLEKKITNPNLSFYVVDGRGHNPNYTDEAVAYMNDAFSTLYKLKTHEEKSAYMADKTAMNMTHQDKRILDMIVQMIEKD